MDPSVAAVAATQLPSDGSVAAPSRGVAAALRGGVRRVLDVPLGELADGAADAVALLDGELSEAGPHAEGLLAEAFRVLATGGLLLVAAPNRLHAQATGRELGALRGFTARELEHALAQRGLAVELVCAPGAASALAGRSDGAYDPVLDRQPGLLDAAARVVAVGRRPPDAASRSAAFFSSLPRKIVAAAVLCRDDAGRVLVVHDSFKRHWTIPGGVVDADEDPRAGAIREAWEESGIRVRAGALLGVFAASWPDRLIFVYAARPADDGAPRPAPLHAHEIDAAAWLDLDDALARLGRDPAFQVRRCLEAPGGTWQQPPDL